MKIQLSGEANVDSIVLKMPSGEDICYRDVCIQRGLLDLQDVILISDKYDVTDPKIGNSVTVFDLKTLKQIDHYAVCKPDPEHLCVYVSKYV